MALHACPHSFETLAQRVFPALFSQLDASINQPLCLQDFVARPAVLPISAGCYVVVECGVAKYVGIAKNIRRRLADHLSGNPSKANLVVRMAAKAAGVSLSKIRHHPQFNKAFDVAHARLLNCGVGWVEITNPLEMYIFEPYCAMRLDTHEFNFFDTLQILAPARSSRGSENRNVAVKIMDDRGIESLQVLGFE